MKRKTLKRKILLADLGTVAGFAATFGAALWMQASGRHGLGFAASVVLMVLTLSCFGLSMRYSDALKRRRPEDD